jgi:hypothetical protein
MSDADTPLKDPTPAVHSDNEKSAVPDRDDAARKGAPNDPPGPSNDEPPVG